MRGRAIVTAAAVVLLGALPAWADFRLERRVALASGGTVVVEADRGSVTVVGDGVTDVTVLITSRRDDVASRMEFAVDGDGRSARITGKLRSRERWWPRESWRGLDGLHFDVHVPQRADVTVQTSGGAIRLANLDGRAQLTTSGGGVTVQRLVGPVQARTSGGPVTIEDVRGEVDAKTSGGQITAARVAGDVRVSTSGGPIRVDDVTGNVVATTSGGGITVRDAAGRVEARTSGGPIRATFSPGNQHGGRLATSGGSVDAVLDPAARLSIDAATSGGSVVSDLPAASRVSTSRRELQADLNGGGALLELRTSGGSIRVSAGSTRNGTSSGRRP